MYTEAYERAAHAIVDRLRRDELVDCAEPARVVAELEAVLIAFEQDLTALAEEVCRSVASVVQAQVAYQQALVERGWGTDDHQIAFLTTALIACLDESEAIDELYANDEQLLRIVKAALMDFVEAQERRVLGLLREPFAAAAGPVVGPRAAPTTPRFADLGEPFPLFEGPVDAADLDEEGPCVECGTKAAHRFRGGCYACFRAGKVQRPSAGTELGMIIPENVVEELTHGTPPGFDPRGTTTVPSDDAEPWVRYRVAGEWLTELLRTPAYSSWQDETWLFCCARPMVFRGPLDDSLLGELVLETKGSSESVVAALLECSSDDAEVQLDRALRGSLSIFVFRCPTCRRHRGLLDRS
ncbi:MAG: CbrC family protein [Polyangiaceae bacterium]